MSLILIGLGIVVIFLVFTSLFSTYVVYGISPKDIWRGAVTYNDCGYFYYVPKRSFFRFLTPVGGPIPIFWFAGREETYLRVASFLLALNIRRFDRPDWDGKTQEAAVRHQLSGYTIFPTEFLAQSLKLPGERVWAPDSPNAFAEIPSPSVAVMLENMQKVLRTS